MNEQTPQDKGTDPSHFMPDAVLEDSDGGTHTPGEKGAQVSLAGKQQGKNLNGYKAHF